MKTLRTTTTMTAVAVVMALLAGPASTATSGPALKSDPVAQIAEPVRTCLKRSWPWRAVSRMVDREASKRCDTGRVS